MIFYIIFIKQILLIIKENKMNIDGYIHYLKNQSNETIAKYYNATMGYNPYISRRDFINIMSRIYNCAKNMITSRTTFSNSFKEDYLIIENNFYLHEVPQLARLRTFIEINKRSISKFLSPIICSIATKALTSYSNWTVAAIGITTFIIAPKILDATYALLRKIHE